jgi:Mor family transcriptional regulator
MIRMEPPVHPAEWNLLTEDQQLVLSREALKRAAETLADHAEILAAEMEDGALLDRGGPDALRLFAAVVRTTNREAFGEVGHA